MNVNFEIAGNNIELNYEGLYIDLHNNFDFVSFEYDVRKRELILTWTKSTGDWVAKDELAGLDLLHEDVTFLKITEQDIERSGRDGCCLGEISFFPSTSREINDCMITQSTPNEGDDIMYFFENGQIIRVHCEQITVLARTADDQNSIGRKG